MSSIQPSSFSKQFASLEITDIQLTGKILGKGSDATVKEVDWVGTSCAAKQLHEILLEDQSPGGAKRFVDNFERECMTWSKLTHPHIVQFLGVYYLSGSRVPMLILEKMDTTLRRYLEKHTNENFVLPDKIYVLRQVAQALSYLHSRSPPLVHHDLSSNNVLLNEVSLQAKVTDFGMTRAMDPSKMTRKSSVKGTPVFMPPEALRSPPKYDEKLDVFSYGNVIVTTVIHDWPEPGPSNKYEGDNLIALTEFQRREQYLNQFNQIENNLFLPIVSSCLENRPHQRPSSFHLVTRMREIEESHPRRVEDSTDIHKLHQDLRLKDELLCEKDQQLRINDIQFKKILEESGQQWEEINHLQTERGQHLREIDSLCKNQDELRKDRDRENEQFHQELIIKENTIHQKDAQLKEQTDQVKALQTVVTQQQTLLQRKDAQLKHKGAELRHKDEESGCQYAEQNDPTMRPTSIELVTMMKGIEESHPRRAEDSTVIPQLRQDLQLKDEQLREKDQQLREQDRQLKQKDAELRHKDEESGHQYAVLLQEHQQLQQECDQLRRERDQLQRESSRSLSTKPGVKKPPRNWKDMKCQKILKCGGQCWAVAIQGNQIAVGVPNQIKVYDRNSTDLLHTIGKGQLGRYLPGVTFYDQEHILVSDDDNSNIKMFTIQGRHVRTIDRGSTTFRPQDITISPDGHIYVCDGAKHCICVFDVNGKFLFSFGSRGSGDECFEYPRDLCFASDGFLYITDFNNSRICVYDKDGKFIRKFTTTYKPTCIDVTDFGHLIVGSFGSHKVMIYTTGGDLVHVFGERGSELGQFSHPTGVSVDSDGLIYIVDSKNHRIQVF